MLSMAASIAPDAFVHLCLGDVEHWGDPNHVAVQTALSNEQAVGSATLKERTRSARIGFVRPVVDELDRLHEALATEFGHPFVGRYRCLQTGGELPPASQRICLHVLIFERLQRCVSSSSRQRVAAECRERGDLDGVHDFGSGHYAGQRLPRCRHPSRT